MTTNNPNESSEHRPGINAVTKRAALGQQDHQAQHVKSVEDRPSVPHPRRNVLESILAKIFNILKEE
jgi:hypothetical protein